MISRKSTKILAEMFFDIFAKYSSRYDIHGNRQRTYSLDNDALYDFLFESDYEPWILNAIKNLRTYDKRSLKEFIMKLHTGESLSNATINWSWEQRMKLGQRLIKDLAEDILNHVQTLSVTYSDVISNKNNLISTLELDGYLYRDNIIYFSESSIIDVEETHGILAKLILLTSIENHDTIIHHLNLSEEHYINNKWDDSISNSRKFLEGILQEVASRHHILVSNSRLSISIFEKPFEIRNYLESVGLIEKKEKEAISKNYSLLSETGSHPYIAEKDQARLLRYISLTFAEFILLRFNGFINTLE